MTIVIDPRRDLRDIAAYELKTRVRGKDRRGWIADAMSVIATVDELVDERGEPLDRAELVRLVAAIRDRSQVRAAKTAGFLKGRVRTHCGRRVLVITDGILKVMRSMATQEPRTDAERAEHRRASNLKQFWDTRRGRPRSADGLTRVADTLRGEHHGDQRTAREEALKLPPLPWKGRLPK